jgi:site-specific recombinase XerC
MTSSIAAPVPAVRPAPLDRLPGTANDDPFLRLAAAWLLGHPTNTAKAYRRDLESWAAWCTRLGVHPLAAERHHVDAWVRYLTTEPQPRTGRPATAATVARKLSALAGFYDYGVHDAGVLTHSPVASVRRPKVSDESQAIGLTADELKRLLAAAVEHSPRSAALVSVLTFCGLRISEALGADVRDYGHDHGHRVLKVRRKGGKTARVALAPPVVRALDTYLDGRSDGPIFLATNGRDRYGYKIAYEQLGRLCKTVGLPAGGHPAQPAPLVRNRVAAPGSCAAGRAGRARARRPAHHPALRPEPAQPRPLPQLPVGLCADGAMTLTARPGDAGRGSVLRRCPVVARDDRCNGCEADHLG